MMRIIYVFALLFTIGYILSVEKIDAIELIDDVKIYNIETSDKYIVYEHIEIVDNKERHHISVLNIETGVINKILNNLGEYINDDLYFPSISNDGKYIVFTSRADNITNDSIGKCIDILDGVIKNCSNVYLYDVVNKNSVMIRYGDEYFNGDNYIAKISGSGKYIVFESSSTNLIYDNYDCTSLNGISNCINIYKYSVLSNKVSLISTGRNNNGGNSNSVSPSISDDGRYITYQSSATNILSNVEMPKYCNNYTNNELHVCSYIYLVDTVNLSTKIISKHENNLFNDNSGNAKISGNGKFIAYESYSTDLANNGKKHIYLHDIDNEANVVVTKNNTIYYNRDSILDDISYSGDYIVFKTTATNVGKNDDSLDLYVLSIKSKFSSIIDDYASDVVEARIIGNDIIYYCEDKVFAEKLDEVPPVIQESQVIYGLLDKTLDIKNKIVVSDNLSSREKIDVYIDKIEILKNVGEYEMLVTAIDEFENVASTSIKIVIMLEDIEAPIFHVSSEIKILKGSSALNLNNYVEAVDKIDGNTRIYIVDDGGLDLNASGTYKITLMSQDATQNISYKEINVIVYDNYNFEYFYELALIIGIIGVIIFSIIKVK